MTKQSNLTVKGQVTMPKDVRDEADYGRRYKEALAAIDRVTQEYRPYQSGRCTDDIMRDLRGDEPPP